VIGGGLECRVKLLQRVRDRIGCRINVMGSARRQEESNMGGYVGREAKKRGRRKRDSVLRRERGEAAGCGSRKLRVPGWGETRSCLGGAQATNARKEQGTIAQSAAARARPLDASGDRSRHNHRGSENRQARTSRCGRLDSCSRATRAPSAARPLNLPSSCFFVALVSVPA
jgi:hypothetical protein